MGPHGEVCRVRELLALREAGPGGHLVPASLGTSTEMTPSAIHACCSHQVLAPLIRVPADGHSGGCPHHQITPLVRYLTRSSVHSLIKTECAHAMLGHGTGTHSVLQQHR